MGGREVHSLPLIQAWMMYAAKDSINTRTAGYWLFLLF